MLGRGRLGGRAHTAEAGAAAGLLLKDLPELQALIGSCEQLASGLFKEETRRREFTYQLWQASGHRG